MRAKDSNRNIAAAYGIDPVKLEDLKQFAEQVKELDQTEFAYISGAVYAMQAMKKKKETA